ncbi:MAG: glycerophosphodiester phosphodiesterase family protein [Nannocystaceae bacterium]
MLCALVASTCNADGSPDGAAVYQLLCASERVVNCGHRGSGPSEVSNLWPENTLPAFVAAEADGADMVELDVHLSADGHVVVIHDDTLERTTSGRGCVSDHTLAELQALDAGRGTPLAGQGVRIPTLAEVAAAIDLDLNIELKIEASACPPPDRERFAAAVLAALASDDRARRVVFSSFDAEVLSALRPLAPESYLVLIATDLGGVAIAEAREFAGLNLWHGALVDVEAMMMASLDLSIWTVNDDDDLRAALAHDVTLLITDHPAWLHGVRTEHCGP